MRHRLKMAGALLVLGTLAACELDRMPQPMPQPGAFGRQQPRSDMPATSGLAEYRVDVSVAAE